MCGGYRDAGIGVAEAENVGKIISGIVCIFNGFACNCVAVYLAANTSRYRYKSRSLMSTKPIKSKGSKKFYSVCAFSAYIRKIRFAFVTLLTKLTKRENACLEKLMSL
uniref:Uncharacterized protein n=1 Tax=Glossina palpalis gambiensis TaxID=67801 RepID=A0A1B0BPZ1_9MUSC